MKIRPVILCGGSGTRLWPLSTPQQPKQFLSLTGSRSMIALTAERIQADDAGFSCLPVRIIGSARHANLLEATLPQAEILLEPFGRNSAPAVAAAALWSSPEELVLILPADHHIEDAAGFRAAIARGAQAASDGRLVTFGVEPSYPATGYGYIRTHDTAGDILGVEQFVEKPPLDLAETYVASGNYFWNAGIFLFQAGQMIDAFERHAPEILSTVKSALSSATGRPRQLDAEAFRRAENISIDYAIMEKADNISLVPVDIGWSDVGGYDALWALHQSDQGTSTVTQGPVIAESSPDCFIRSEGPSVSVSGITNTVIIVTTDHVMVSSRDDQEAVKRLGAKAQANPLALSVSATTRERARELLWAAFETWSECAWDPRRGGFVESLGLDGRPNIDLGRRVRVQARQVFSFAEAVRLGWDVSGKAEDLVQKGLAYLDAVCRHPDGGWGHLVSAEGKLTDQTRDLYDHAFILLAGAAARRAVGSELGEKLARQALEYIDANLRTDDGGFADSDSAPHIRRANPHMHLLEACLEWHGATSDPFWLSRASKVVNLFETHFFDSEHDFLREHMIEGWKPAPGERGIVFEPGHHYEWANLLADHDRRTGRDTLSWRRRLIAKADRDGRDPTSGFAHNEVRSDDGTVTNANRRLWHQLEAFRARLWHPGTAPPGAADLSLEAIETTYFSGMPAGTWCDETDAEGRPVAKAIPASMLYHLVTAFRDILPDGTAGA